MSDPELESLLESAADDILRLESRGSRERPHSDRSPEEIQHELRARLAQLGAEAPVYSLLDELVASLTRQQKVTAPAVLGSAKPPSSTPTTPAKAAPAPTPASEKKAAEPSTPAKQQASPKKPASEKKPAPAASAAPKRSEEDDIAATMAKMFEQMSASAQNLGGDGEDMSEAEAAELMQKLMSEMMGGSPDGAQGGDLMQNMMENILSKELLYPSLLEVSQKYPQWLDEKRLSIPPADHERYTKQYACIKEIVAIYESSMDSKKQTQLVMEKMERMQDLGTPPADLVEGGDAAIPKLPTGEQCSVM